MQNRKDSLILKQKGNYIPLLKHGEIVARELQKQEIYTEKRTDNCFE